MFCNFLALRSLAIREKALGPNHPYVATSLSELALLYYKQDRYSEAEPLNKRSLAIREKALGPDHPAVGTSLNNLAALYFKQGRYADAEPLFRRSLAIWEKALGPHHPNIANSLNHLTELYWSQGRYADALPLVQELVASGRAVPASVLPAVECLIPVRSQSTDSEASNADHPKPPDGDNRSVP